MKMISLFRTSGGAGIALTALIALIAGVGPTYAVQTCVGTYTASRSANATLPAPVVVQLNSSGRSSGSGDLEAHFLAGMHDARVTTDGAPTVQMNLTASARPARSHTSTGAYVGFGWAANPSPGSAPLMNASLNMSVTLVDSASAAILWTAVIKCIVKTEDRGALAQDLGLHIGRIIGKSNYDPKPL